MRQIKLIFIFTVLMFVGKVQAQNHPGKVITERVCLTNGTLHLGTGEVIEQGDVHFQNGKIVAVGKNLPTQECGQVISAEDQHVYPGFIAPNSTLGLVEVGAVRASRDQRETGAFNPHVRSIIAYNTESHITETVRSNGVLMGQITPRGGWVSGTSTVVHFDAWNWEDAAIALDQGLHVNWPSKYRQTGWWAEPGPVLPNDKYVTQKKELEQFFSEAKTFPGKPKDLRMEAMQWAFSGSQIVYVHCDSRQEIMDVLAFKKKFAIQKLVLVGGYEAAEVAEALKEAEVGVLLRRVHDLPLATDEHIHAPFLLPKKLYDAGVKFAFENAGDMEQMQTRNLPTYGGTAVAFGLPYEEAVKSLTLHTAELLGIGEQYGSLEKGKSATLFVSEGDALDMLTNALTHAWIEGKEIDLSNRQRRLYEKFKRKYSNE